MADENKIASDQTKPAPSQPTTTEQTPSGPPPIRKTYPDEHRGEQIEYEPTGLYDRTTEPA